MLDDAFDGLHKIRCIAININHWHPDDTTFNQLVSLLDERGQARVQAFKIRRDALSSLIGRLIPVAVYCLDHSLPWRSISIDRESKGRPFLIRDDGDDALFDYNDTHDENCVAVAMTSLFSRSDPLRLGIDVMRVALPQGLPTLADFKETLEDMTSPTEWQSLSKLTGEELLDALLRLWTAKEAVSKALGEGLSFPYRQIALRPPLTATWQHLVVNKTPCCVRHYDVIFESEKYMIAIANLNTDPTASPEMPDSVEVRDMAWLLERLRTMTGQPLQ